MPQSDPMIPQFGDVEVKNGIQAPHVAARLEMEHFRRNSFTANELSTCVTPEKTGGVTVYGYRHYSSKTGQFLGRDPITEQGGVNLYGFVGNDGVSRIDLLGLFIPSQFVVKVAGYFEWWLSNKGPGGKNGSFYIGQWDNYLYTTGASAKVGCHCGAAVLIDESDPDIKDTSGLFTPNAKGYAFAKHEYLDNDDGSKLKVSILSASQSTGNGGALSQTLSFVGGLGGSAIPGLGTVAGGAAGTIIGAGLDQLWNAMSVGDGRIRYDFTFICEKSDSICKYSKPKVKQEFKGDIGVGNRWKSKNYVPIDGKWITIN
jgi:RHS repeat-associated protein